MCLTRSPISSSFFLAVLISLVRYTRSVKHTHWSCGAMPMGVLTLWLWNYFVRLGRFLPAATDASTDRRTLSLLSLARGTSVKKAQFRYYNFNDTEAGGRSFSLASLRRSEAVAWRQHPQSRTDEVSVIITALPTTLAPPPAPCTWSSLLPYLRPNKAQSVPCLTEKIAMSEGESKFEN